MNNLLLNKKAIDKFLEDVDPNKKILEVGPLQTPLFTKENANIYFADIKSTEEIKNRFSNDSKVNMDKIIPIDYVIKDSYENTFKNTNIKFDYVLLNNVFEHIPNPIEYLLDISKILNKNGKIGLLLPDREFSIDYYRTNTSFTDWFDVYIRGEYNNTPRLALDFSLNHINDRNARNYWNNNVRERPHPNLINCIEWYKDLIKNFENHYFDEHYWAFTDRSFLRIIETLFKLKIIPFKISSFYPTAYNDNVFGIMMELDYNMTKDNVEIEKEIQKINETIDYIEKTHFELKASDLIRENMELKNEINSKSQNNSKISAEDFFKKFENLKKTVKGENDYLFLVNDGNSEIRQHFDKNYKTKNFNPKEFIRNFLIKKELLSQKNIESYYFIVPDKSVVCRDLLPFNHENYIKRNYDFFKELFPDFSSKLDSYDYYKYDTHMKLSGGRKLSFCILNHINPKLTIKKFNDMLKEFNYEEKPLFDLLSDENWSYSEEEKRKFDSAKYNSISNPGLKDISEKIPQKFESTGNTGRKSFHFINKNSISDKRVLFFHDSSIHALANFLKPYYRESFFYWDHLNLNKEIIEWYKPDLIIEIRIERFLENYVFPEWISNKNF